jgi:hypothetical protein
MFQSHQVLSFLSSGFNRGGVFYLKSNHNKVNNSTPLQGLALNSILKNSNPIVMFISVTRTDIINQQNPPLKKIQIHIEIHKVFLIDIYTRS